MNLDLITNDQFLWACEAGDIKKVIRITNGDPTYDYKTPNRFELTGFHLACIGGFSEIVTYLLLADKNSLTYVDNTGWNGLHYACREGHKRIVNNLLPLVEDHEGNTKDNMTYMKCAEIENQESVIKILNQEIEKEPSKPKKKTLFRFRLS